MTTGQPAFVPLAVKTVVVHTVTYVVMGVLASSLLDYRAAFARPDMACWMRQITDPIVMAGPLFQPLRGIVFALVIYPLREVIFGRSRGWLVLWWVLVALGILATFGPAPGSFEGLVFTVISPRSQLTGYLEVVPQAFLLAFILVYWVEHPDKRWLTRVMAVAFALAIGLPLLGLLAGAGGSS
jgi:hypothetical protein